jgi:hypothetical protein
MSVSYTYRRCSDDTVHTVVYPSICTAYAQLQADMTQPALIEPLTLHTARRRYGTAMLRQIGQCLLTAINPIQIPNQDGQ